MKIKYLVVILMPLLFFAFTEEEIEDYERQSYEQLNNDRATNAIYDGAVEELDRVFSDDNLAILDIVELRLLRNTIFAAHGYIFRSKDLQEWFSKFEWYEPLTDNVDDYLTWVDTFNIAKIKKFEAAHKKGGKSGLEDGDLIGIWHTSPVVAAGYNDLLYFFPDHKFRIAYNQMDWGKRLTGMSGTWTLDGDVLILKVKEKSIIEGGEIVEPTASCVSDFAIEGGESKKIKIDPPEFYVYPIGGLEIQDLGAAEMQVRKITIGTHDVWLMSADPDAEIY